MRPELSSADAFEALLSPPGADPTPAALRAGYGAVGLLWVLNLVDAGATLLWIRGGLAAELNPVMAALLHLGDGPFLLAKLAAGTLATFALLLTARLPAVRVGVLSALGIYALVSGAHLAHALHAVGLLGLGG